VKWLIPKLAEFQALHPDIEVRISTSLNIVDLQHDDIDLAIRFGAGDWPGMVVDHLLEEDIFPVCSPGLLEGRHPLKSPWDLVHHTLLHTTLRPDNWRLWLTAAGVPTDPEDKNHIDPMNGPIFDQSLITIQAAVDGLGVAIVSGEFVERDLEEGRLVRPFDVSLPTQAAYYLVSPKETAEAPKIKAFRAWLQGLVSQ
jgi:LysR family glycine cleavage system transcriptional activator